MDYAGFNTGDGGVPSSGYITELTSTDNGIVLSPNPLGGGFIDASGSISLAVDLKTINNNIALGFNNWQVSSNPTGYDNLAVGNLNQSNTIGNYNIALGNTIGPYIGSNNTILGQNNCSYLTGDNNFIEGKNILSADPATGNNNVILSNDVFTQASDSVENTVLIGNSSMSATTLSTNDCVIGSNNLQNMTTTNLNKIVGYNNLNGTGNALNNQVLGHNCLATQVSPTNNIIVGSNVLTVGETANSNIIIGNSSGSDGNVVLDNIMIGNNNGDITGNMTGALLIGTNIQMSSPTSAYTSVIGGLNTVVPSGNGEKTTLIQGDYVGLGNMVLNPRYDVESEHKLALRSIGNFRSLKNVSWNYSNIFAFSVNDNTSVFASIDMESDIQWEPDVATSPNNKSVMLTLEFSCMQLSDNGTFYGTAGGSVSFMIHKNAGFWIFPDNSTSYSLLSNAQTRGTYSFMAGGGNISAVQVSQSSFGNPNIIFWLKYGSLVQCPTGTWTGYGTCSTQIRAQCSTNLVN